MSWVPYVCVCLIDSVGSWNFKSVFHHTNSLLIIDGWGKAPLLFPLCRAISTCEVGERKNIEEHVLKSISVLQHAQCAAVTWAHGRWWMEETFQTSEWIQEDPEERRMCVCPVEEWRHPQPFNGTLFQPMSDFYCTPVSVPLTNIRTAVGGF